MTIRPRTHTQNGKLKTMLVKLKGLAKTNKRLADGSIRTYFYAWRGGPLLKNRDGEPIQRKDDPEIHVAFADAHRELRERPKGTLGSIIASFRNNTALTGKAVRTQEEYRRYLDLIDDRWGSTPLHALENIKTRGKFKSWRESMSENPRKADYAWSVLARVLSFAKDNGVISTNICEKGGRLYSSDRSEKIWDADQIRSMMLVASHPLQVAMMLALWTGQRQGDLLALPWSAYDGTSLRVKQGKTGARVKIPVTGLLKEVLDEEAKNKKSTTILTNTRGQSWTRDGFKTSWGKATKKAEVEDRTFHDLRGTAVTRLALAGCEVSEIASITGHSIKDAASILDAHYLGGRFELAEQGIGKLVAHQTLKSG